MEATGGGRMKYSNGVDARVGDKFRYTGRLPQYSIESKYDIEFLDNLYKNYGIEIELLHRPFQVGDFVRVRIINGNCPEWIKDTYHYDIGDWDIEHENPLWRDHPDYVGEENT